jgi:hypothetical protein
MTYSFPPEKYAFLITVSADFPQDPNYLPLVDTLYRILGEEIQSYSSRRKESNSILKALSDSVSETMQFFGQKSSWTWQKDTQESTAYGIRRPERLDHVWGTVLSTYRYLDSHAKLVKYYPELAAPGGHCFVVHKTEQGEELQTNFLLYNPPPGSFADQRLIGDKRFNLLHTGSFVVFTEPLSPYQDPEKYHPASISQVLTSAEAELRTFLWPELQPPSQPDLSPQDLHQLQIRSLINVYRAVTLACEFGRGGSTYANVLLLVLADHINLELPLVKLGETAWFYTATLPHEEYHQQFQAGLRQLDLIRQGFLPDKAETFFDPTLTATEVINWHLQVLEMNKLSPTQRRQTYCQHLNSTDRDSLWYRDFVLPYLPGSSRATVSLAETESGERCLRFTGFDWSPEEARVVLRRGDAGLDLLLYLTEDLDQERRALLRYEDYVVTEAGKVIPVSEYIAISNLFWQASFLDDQSSVKSNF